MLFFIIGNVLLPLLITVILAWYFWIMIMVNRMPGPPTYPLIGNLIDICVPSDQLWHLLRRLAKQYYPVYRIWSGPFTAIAFLEPEDVELLLSTTKHIKKSRLYYLLEPWLGTGLLTSTGEKWHNRRKILTPAFHFNILQKFIPIFTEVSQHLADSLQGECKKEHTDVVPIITKFTLHAICETAMGIRLSEQKTKQNSYVEAIYKMGELMVHRVIRPWLYLEPFYIFSPKFWERRKIIKYLHNFSQSVIRERKLSYKERDFTKDEDDGIYSKKRLAMLDLLISAQKSGLNIDDTGIREEVDTFMFEGHDTTSMCISFTLLLLANNQHIQEKVVDEINGIFEDSQRTATFQDLQNLCYLEMVLKESLRMYPSVPLIARVTDESIRTKSGYLVPGWVFVHVYIYDLHHNPRVFPNPEIFDPDRFLPENSQKRHPFAYIPFSAGPRNCIGQKFAMLEIKAVILSILRNFKLIAVDKPEDIVLVTDLLIRPRDGIKIKFEPRC